MSNDVNPSGIDASLPARLKITGTGTALDNTFAAAVVLVDPVTGQPYTTGLGSSGLLTNMRLLTSGDVVTVQTANGTPIVAQAQLYDANGNPVKTSTTGGAVRASLTDDAGQPSALSSYAFTVAGILPNSLLDVSAYASFSVQFEGSSGLQLIVQCSNDGSNWHNYTWTQNGNNNVSGSIGVGQVLLGSIRFKYMQFSTSGSISGTATATLLLSPMASNIAPTILQAAPVATASTVGATSYHLISAANTNGANVKNGAGQVYGGHVANNSASNWAYLKFYNKASSPTVGTDTVVYVVGVPPSGSVPFEMPVGLVFSIGISIAITGAMADSDTTSTAANQVAVSLGYK